MEKVVDFNQTISQLYDQDPEIINIMKEIGFKDIDKAGMMKTMGKVMTIPKGARIKKIDMQRVREVFKNKGYKIME